MKTHSSATALAWSFGNTAFSKLATLGIGVLLARLLGPHSFGTFAVALVALTIVLSFNELGVSLAIVRWPGDPARIAPTVSTISTAVSVAIYVAGYCAAPAFAQAMGAPAAVWPLRVLLFSVVIDAITSSPAALLERGFRQDKRALADQLNVWVGAGVSVILAFAHWGAMSLAVGRISGSLVAAVVLVAISPVRLRFGFDPSIARQLLRFGLPLAGASIVVIAAGNVDQLVVGRMLGPTSLGFFVLAFNIASWPVSIFSQPMRSVAPATFARLRDDPTQRLGAFRSIIRVLTVAALPVCGFLAGAADPIVRFVYGIAWLPAADVLRFLAGAAALRIIFELAYDYLVVQGRTGRLLTLQLVWLLALLPALIVGAHFWGLVGVAAAEVAVALIVVLPAYLGLLRGGGIPVRTVLSSVVLPVGGGVGVALVALSMSSLRLPPLLACIGAGVIALAVAAALAWRERSSVQTIRSVRSTAVVA
ncbi:lipopolysaccharide biosynthesis protein [Gryllotalpicola protaetiae]|uniref:Lipopolysaccharide biosynthesis protein n=1 Tax=Gryllotalpicola protaetiae TaxID=2419771 RepID=A0A387BPZ9_9MICO|nr:lipopolysaccharide biosynthesis protein [Gryllotalpicola protaetiae]AYG03189.1 lipopolysaccharide biosynthesis protein [Gryllotalpicola protaetiae]